MSPTRIIHKLLLTGALASAAAVTLFTAAALAAPVAPAALQPFIGADTAAAACYDSIDAGIRDNSSNNQTYTNDLSNLEIYTTRGLYAAPGNCIYRYWYHIAVPGTYTAYGIKTYNVTGSITYIGDYNYMSPKPGWNFYNWSMNYAADGGSTAQGSKTVTIGLMSCSGRPFTGTLNAIYRPVDYLNNRATCTQIVAVDNDSITYDSAAPTTSWVTPSSTVYQTSTSYTFDWGFNGGGGTGYNQSHLVLQRATLNNGSCSSWANYTDLGTTTAGATTRSDLSSGYCWRMAARTQDLAENWSGWAYSSAIIVDTVAPSPAVAGTPSADDFSNATSYTWSWSFSDPAPSSGFKNNSHWYRTATLSNGACGTWSSWQGGTNNTAQSRTISSLADKTCYQVIVRTWDNAGNQSSSDKYLPVIMIDRNGGSASINDNTSSRTDAYRSGSTIYYNPNAAGSLNFTITGTDTVSGIDAVRFIAATGTTTGWSPTGASSWTTTNPYTRAYSWTSGATGSPVFKGEVRNNSGLVTASAARTMVPDGTAPTATIEAPADAGGDIPVQTETAVTVSFTASDAGSGFGASYAGWTLQRQIASSPSPGTCGTFADDPAPDALSSGSSSGAQSRTDTVPGTSCYRWKLTATDSVSNEATAYSGTVLVYAPGPQTIHEGTEVYGYVGTTKLTQVGSSVVIQATATLRFGEDWTWHMVTSGGEVRSGQGPDMFYPNMACSAIADGASYVEWRWSGVDASRPARVVLFIPPCS